MDGAARSLIPPPEALRGRIRLLFSAFSVLVAAIAVVDVLAEPSREFDVTLGLAGAAAAAAWAVARYRLGESWWILDVVPPLSIAAIGVATGGPGIPFGLAYVTLFFRAQYGRRWAVLASAPLWFGGYAVAAAAAPTGLLVDDAVTTMIAMLFSGWALHMLGELAARHEAAVERERMLTSAGARLLAAQFVDEVREVALSAARDIVGQGDALVTFWPSTAEGVRLGAVDGEPFPDETPAIAFDALPHEVVEDFLAGRPFVVGETVTRSLNVAHGREDDPAVALVVVPVPGEAGVLGALVVSCLRPPDRTVLEVLERYGIEVSLSFDRVRLIEELRVANADLKRADELKDRFVSNVSHELRTPLTSMCGFTQMLDRRWDAFDDAQRLELVRRVGHQAHRQRRLVDELLIASRLMSARLDTVPEDVPLALAVDEAIANAGLVIDVDRTIDPALHVRVDREHLERIVTNLLTNAQRYGGPPFAVTAEADGSEAVVLRVRDHGGGVPDRFVPHLFERFRQADGPTQLAGSGVGLGLSIVADLVRLNGGVVRYEPAGGGGACFAVTLPAPSASARTVPGSAGTPASS